MKSVTLIVLNNFKHDSRVLKESVSLKKSGYDVQVVALWENGLNEHETVQDIPVHRIKLKSKNWSKNKFVQLVKYLEFIYRTVKEYKDRDILHCNDLNTLPIGYIIKKFYNKKMKIVYDAHEYETEMNGLKGIQKTIVKILERFLIKYADKVITVSDAIANEYVKLYNIEKPALVLNAPPYKEIEKKDIFRERLGISKEQTIFLYQGGLSSGRGIEILLETFKIMDKNAVIVFMGYGVLEKEIQEASKEYPNIYFYPAVPPDVLLDYTSSADFGIHMAQSHCLSYYYALPNKFLEYLMAELPILVTDLPEMAKIIKLYNIGEIIQGNDSKALKKAINKIMRKDLRQMEKNIFLAKNNYSWQKQEKILLKVYEDLI